MIGRLKSPSSPARVGVHKGKKARLSEKKIISSAKKLRINKLMSEIDQKNREELITGLVGKQHEVNSDIISSIREVLNNRVSSDREHEGVRSTIISACCGPQVQLRALSKIFMIYENRNYHRLKIYRARRENYMSGATKHMRGYRYASEH